VQTPEDKGALRNHVLYICSWLTEYLLTVHYCDGSVWCLREEWSHMQSRREHDRNKHGRVCLALNFKCGYRRRTTSRGNGQEKDLWSDTVGFCSVSSSYNKKREGIYMALYAAVSISRRRLRCHQHQILSTTRRRQCHRPPPQPYALL
jgi:hypothetical protein